MLDFRRITLFVWDTDSQSTQRLLFKKFGGHGLCAPHMLVKPLGPFFAAVHNILREASLSDSEKKYHLVQTGIWYKLLLSRVISVLFETNYDPQTFLKVLQFV